jgi:hypothetical protein
MGLVNFLDYIQLTGYKDICSIREVFFNSELIFTIGRLAHMSQDCCQPAVTTMILACSGGSNVGQLSNQAAIELTQEGFCKLSCLAGVGAHLSGFVQCRRRRLRFRG